MGSLKLGLGSIRAVKVVPTGFEQVTVEQDLLTEFKLMVSYSITALFSAIKEKFNRFMFNVASQTCVQKVSFYFVWGVDLRYLADCTQRCFVFFVMGQPDIPEHHIAID